MNEQASQSYYFSVIQAMKVTIKAEKHPEVLLTADQLNRIQKELMHLILEKVFYFFYPRFERWILVSGSNQSSHEWMPLVNNSLDFNWNFYRRNSMSLE